MLDLYARFMLPYVNAPEQWNIRLIIKYIMILIYKSFFIAEYNIQSILYDIQNILCDFIFTISYITIG